MRGSSVVARQVDERADGLESEELLQNLAHPGVTPAGYLGEALGELLGLVFRFSFAVLLAALAVAGGVVEPAPLGDAADARLPAPVQVSLRVEREQHLEVSEDLGAALLVVELLRLLGSEARSRCRRGGRCDGAGGAVRRSFRPEERDGRVGS